MSQIDDHPVHPRKPTAGPDFTLRRAVGICVETILCTIMIMAATAGVCVYLVPKEYYSQALLEVQLRPHFPDEYQSWNRQTTAEKMAGELVWMQTQSPIIFYQVINRFDLTRVYAAPGKILSQEEAYLRLKRSVCVREAPKAGQFELGVHDCDAQRAADLANTIAVQYRKVRTREQHADTDRGLQELRDEFEKQRHWVEKAKKRADVLRERYHIVDPDPSREDFPAIFAGDANYDLDPQTEENRNAQMSQYLDAKRRYIRGRKLLEVAEKNYSSTRSLCGAIFPAVFIMEKAEPSDRPARPNIPLYLTWEARAGLLVGIARVVLAAATSRCTRMDHLSCGSGSV